MGRYSQAVAASRKALELDPKLIRARRTLGSALIRMGKSEEGKKELKKLQ